MVSLAGQRVYLDANAIIYAVEGLVPGLDQSLLDGLAEHRFFGITSELTVLETVVGPRRAGNPKLELIYRRFLRPTVQFVVHPVSTAILEKAIELRAVHNLRTPDAIHVATAMVTQCTVVVSRDKDWHRVGLNIVDPDEIA